MSDLLNARKNIILIVLFAWLIFVILSIFTAALLSISSLKIVIKLQDVLQQKNVNLHNMSDSEEKFVIVEILKLMDENRLFRKKLEDTLCHFNKMQLMSLQKQINPHFLNNMLSMICYRIQNDDNDATAINMIVMLTRIINYGFNNDAVIVPLSQEIDFMKTYITILKEGYRDFEFITDIDESLLNHKVLRLSIQPFVENAFYHGIRRKKSDGRITLSAKKEGQKVVITVEDNGVGMSLDKIREINELIKNGSNSKHIGIYNAYQRLKVVYFDECSLTYESDGVSGTKMTLVTPILIDNNFENFL